DMPEPRWSHTSNLLPSGHVFVVGPGDVASATTYDPMTGVWVTSASPLAPRLGHTATVLTSGKILVAGGVGADFSEICDPISNAWQFPAAMVVGRHYHTADLLPTGKVLVAGGETSYYPLKTAEQFMWKENGAQCMSNDECSSCLCSDGVCCNQAC